MSVMMDLVQTKCKLTTPSYSSELFYIQSKEIGNKKYYEETRELEKWQSQNIEIH